jgi:hypothetical protein
VIRVALLLGLVAIPTAAGAEAPAADAVLAIEPAELPAIRDRLRGQRTTVAADRRSIAIDDIAGEGRPWVGVVERRGSELWLRTAGGSARLTGALARPRIAGPGYTVWVIGAASEGAIAARRLGVLRRPAP